MDISTKNLIFLGPLLRLIHRNIAVFLLIHCLCSIYTKSATADAKTDIRSYYQTFINELEGLVFEKTEKRDFKIAVGEFPCGHPDNEGISTLSRIIQSNVEEAVLKTEFFKLITRDQISTMMEEKKLQSLRILDDNGSSPEISIQSIDGIFKGQYFYEFPEVTVKGRLILFNGGQTYPVSKTIPISAAGTNQILPASRIKEIVTSQILPQNTQKSKDNLTSVKSIIDKIPDQKIKIELWVKGGRSNFANGEKISFLVRSDADCHIAVLDHFIDGSTMMLFPNTFSRNTAISQDSNIEIPGDRSGFEIEIAEPFGGDIVQVIACTNKSELENLLKSATRESGPFSSIKRNTLVTRGAKIMQVDTNSPGNNDKSKLVNSAVVQWGETHIVVNTYP